MIDIAFDLPTGVTRLTRTTAIVRGADVPVRITFSQSPGDVTLLQLALGSDAAPPATLAFTDLFTEENANAWTGLLDASDARLATFMAGKKVETVHVELVSVIDGVKRISPHMQITVQEPVIDGPETSEGGPRLWNVVVYHKAGSRSLHLASADTDAARGAALLAAKAAATTSGDIIDIGPGTFALGAAVLTLPAGVHLKGQGIGVTIITSSADLQVLGAIVAPGNGSVIEDIEIQGVAASAIYQGPLGFHAGFSQPVPATFTARRVKTVGDADGLYLNGGASPGACRGVLENCHFQAKYDAIATLVTSGTWDLELFINGCRMRAEGPSGILYFGTPIQINRGVVVTAGVVYIKGGEIVCTNTSNTTSGPAEMKGVKVDSSGGATGVVHLDGVSINVSRAHTYPMLDLDRVSGTLSVMGGRGSGTNGSYLFSGTVAFPGGHRLTTTTTWDPASLANGASEKKTGVTLNGVAAGDTVKASLSTITSTDWAFQATATAANTVEVKITNNTGGTVDLGSGTLRVTADKF